MSKEKNIDEKNIINKSKKGLMYHLSSGIVKSRFVILVLFIAFAVYCVIGVGRVQTFSDLTEFLSDQTETRRGIEIMNDEFTTYASASIMVGNITYDRACEISEYISSIPHVTSVGFDDSQAHYKNTSALFSVMFDEKSSSENVEKSFDEIKEYLCEYDTYIDTQIGNDLNSVVMRQMTGVMLIAVIVIAAVLLFTSRSYFEVAIFAVVFIFAGILNMGTNFWLGRISNLTNTIATILQLALAIDYAIILGHLYQDEVLKHTSPREALVCALSKAIVEISSSSLTTISGLVAMMFMAFGFGRDLGIVLAKGIVCSLLTVFLLMPALISFFPTLLRRTVHKNLVPNVSKWGKFLSKTKGVFVWIFILIIPFACIASSNVNYAFSEGAVDILVWSDEAKAHKKIADTFDSEITLAVLVPSGNYSNEKAIVDEVSKLDNVKTSLGLSSVEINDGVCLGDELGPIEFAQIANIDVQSAEALYLLYSTKQNDISGALSQIDSYKVPLIDMFSFLVDSLDSLSLDDSVKSTINSLSGTLTMAKDQLKGEKWSRMVFTLSLPVESDESTAIVSQIREIAQNYYGEGEDDVIIVSDIINAADLRASYTSDSRLINVLTIVFVLVILLCTFKSVVGSIVLVFVIQGSIWINFSFAYLMGNSPVFITNLIVTAIQMGATIDYAIVLMNRYLNLRAFYDKKEAMIHAVNESFPTVLTSGTIMTAAGLLIAFRVSNVYIGHIGLAVGRGALISMILVLSVLPQLICLLDTPIRKTTLNFDKKIKRIIEQDKENERLLQEAKDENNEENT